jgi:hypothetical protein
MSGVVRHLRAGIGVARRRSDSDSQLGDSEIMITGSGVRTVLHIVHIVHNISVIMMPFTDSEPRCHNGEDQLEAKAH